MYKVFFNHRSIEFVSKDFHLAGLDETFIYFIKDTSEISRALKFFSNTLCINRMAVVSDNPKETFKVFNFHYMPITAAGGFVVNPAGEILVILRHQKWDLPKGKAEEGEIPSETAIREVEEECGIHNMTIDCPLGETYHTYKLNGIPSIKKTHWFLMRFTGDETPVPQTEEDIQEIRWVKPQEIDTYLSNTYDSLIDIFRKGIAKL